MQNFLRKNRHPIAQAISLIGLGGMLYMTSMAGFDKANHSPLIYELVGWFCGALTVGGIAFLLIEQLEEEKENLIEKLQTKIKDNGGDKV